MKNTCIYLIGLICLATSCQHKGDGTETPADLPDSFADYSSAAHEVNTVFGIENLYYPEDEYYMFEDISNQMDSLLKVYVDRKKVNLSPVIKQENVIDYLNDIDDNIFSVEDWMDEDDLLKYRQSLSLLQKYADAEADELPDKATFPYDETQHILHLFMENMSMLNSEGDGSPSTLQLLYYRYLQQVLAYCPDFEKMTAMVTPDGQAAILNVGDCLYQTYAVPMLLKDTGGCWMPVIHAGKKPNRVYIFPHEDKTFCLFSEHGDLKQYSRFSCSLFMYENNEWHSIEIKDYDQTVWDWYTKKVHRTEGDVQYVEDWDAHIAFNPTERRWNFCYEKDGIYYPHPGSKTLYLDLDMKTANARLRLASEY